MNVAQIRLESSPAKIQINRTPGKQEIHQPKTEVSIEQPKADLTINRTPSKLTIDQTQAWADMEIKPISRTIEDTAQLARQMWLEGIARRAQQGNQLMKIENGGNPLAIQAKSNSEKPMRDFNIGWIPSHGSVKTSFEPSKVELDWKVNQPKIEMYAQKPVIDYNPGHVEVSLAEHQSLKIDFANLKYVGVNYEQEI